MTRNFFAALGAAVLTAFVAMGGVSVCRAQEQSVHGLDENPLISATGPNTVGAWNLQLSAWGRWYGYGEDCSVPLALGDFIVSPGLYLHIPDTMTHVSSSEPGLGVGLRWGLGRRFELAFGLEGSMERNTFTHEYQLLGGSATVEGRSADLCDTSLLLRPTLGIKVLVSDAGIHGWPQIAAFAYYQQLWVQFPDGDFDRPIHGSQLVAGLQFRNCFGSRWTLDYSVHYHYWEYEHHLANTVMFTTQADWRWQFSVMGRWLASERLLLGLGMENQSGCAEALWQASPALRLKARGMFGVSHEPFFDGTLVEGCVVMGVEWTFGG